MKTSMSLKARVLLLSGFMTLVSVSVGAVSYWASNKTITAFQEVDEKDVPSLRALNHMLLNIRMARIELFQIISPDTDEVVDKESLKMIEEAWESYDQDEKHYLSLQTGSEDKALFAEFKKHTTKMRGLFDKVLELNRKYPDQRSPERKEMDRIVLHEIGGQLSKDLAEATRALISIQAKAIDDDTLLAENAAKWGNRLNLIFTILGSLLGMVFSVVFATQLSKKISSIISTISDSTGSVSAASTQIEGASQGLSQATTEQAASLQETTAALEEISSMIAKSANNATEADLCASSSHQKALEGQKTVDLMMNSMQEISKSNDSIMAQINESNRQMTDIVKVIQEIGSKTKVINDIVFQTKLLSFNASVEAARAGEHGKGFAVVAEEVGNLAQMSGTAAQEISSLLEGSVSKVEQIVKDTQHKVESLISDGKSKVDSGVEVANECSSVLGNIVEQVSKVTGLVNEIAQASKEQSLGVAEINKAMAQLDMVTQQNSTSSQESAASAEVLSSQAQSLELAVDELVIAVQGHAGGRKVVAPAHRLIKKSKVPSSDNFSDRDRKAA